MLVPSQYRLLVQVGQHDALNIAIGAIETEILLPPDLGNTEVHTVVIKNLNKVENIFFFKSLETARGLVQDIRKAKTTYKQVEIRLDPDLNQHLLHPNDRAQ